MMATLSAVYEPIYSVFPLGLVFLHLLPSSTPDRHMNMSWCAWNKCDLVVLRLFGVGLLDQYLAGRS